MSSDSNIFLNLEKIYLQHIRPQWLKSSSILNVLRLDTVHPVIGGNKVFKLRYYLQDAHEKSHDTIASWGGAYSNHIVATACACKINGFKSIGIIRGERPAKLSHTLNAALDYGMELHFISRADYNKKILPVEVEIDKKVYTIPEGGYGPLGAKGAAEILLEVPDIESYSHIVCAVGTGTMIAGIVNAAGINHQVIGISALKGNLLLDAAIRYLVQAKDKLHHLKLFHDFHFGGYAKKTPGLLQFMRETWNDAELPTDFVYTGKMLYAIKHLMMNDYFESGSKILIIHSGGLQGNGSLPGKALPF